MTTYKTNCDQENMCESCDWCFAECCAENFKYGEGYGQDNIIECDSYSGSEYEGEDDDKYHWKDE